MSNLQHTQVNTSVLGTIANVFRALCSMLTTVATQGEVFVYKGSNVLINTVSAGEHISKACETRAEIYGAGMVKNGALAERELELKHKIRLYALERQEAAGRANANKPTRAKTAPKKATRAPVKPNGKAKSTANATA
jgi:hypothetical protein